jgi:hypothetical protein
MFPAKVLLWLAISESGISEPFFFEAGLAVKRVRVEWFHMRKFQNGNFEKPLV